MVTRSISDDILVKQMKSYGYVQMRKYIFLNVKECYPTRRKKKIAMPEITWLDGIDGIIGKNKLAEDDRGN